MKKYLDVEFAHASIIKLKKVLIGYTVAVGSVLAIPNIYGALEKYYMPNKIGQLPPYEDDIMRLFSQLEYANKADKLLVNSNDDIDLHHFFGSKKMVIYLLSQLENIVSDGKKQSFRTYGTRTSYRKFSQHKEYIILDSYCCSYDIYHMMDSLSLDKQEVMVLLAVLMDLGLTEYIEDKQSHDMSVVMLTQSGYNSIDLRGNLAGIIAALGADNMMNTDHLCSILEMLQVRYSTTDGLSTLQALSDEFDLDVSIQLREPQGGKHYIAEVNH